MPIKVRLPNDISHSKEMPRGAFVFPLGHRTIYARESPKIKTVSLEAGEYILTPSVSCHSEGWPFSYRFGEGESLVTHRLRTCPITIGAGFRFIYALRIWSFSAILNLQCLHFQYTLMVVREEILVQLRQVSFLKWGNGKKVMAVVLETLQIMWRSIWGC